MMVKADLLIWKLKADTPAGLFMPPGIDMRMVASGHYYGGHLKIVSPGPGTSMEVRGKDPEEVRARARHEVERYRKAIMAEAEEGTLIHEDFSDDACT